MSKLGIQHQVFGNKNILTEQELEGKIMADKQAREEYKRQRAEYFDGIRQAGYLLAVGRRDQIISDWEREQGEDLDGERTEQTI